MNTPMMRVTISGVLGIYEVPLDPPTWNGFAVPRFTRTQAHQLAAETAALATAFPDDTDVVHVGPDATVWIDTHTGDRIDYPADADGLHPIGARLWGWEFLNEECAICAAIIDHTRSTSTTTHHSTDGTARLVWTCSQPCTDEYQATQRR